MSAVIPPPTAKSSLPPPNYSPKWGPNIKLIVGLSFVAIVAALVIYFHNIVGPLLVAFILTYLLHPLVIYISQRTGLSYRSTVNIVYIVLIVLLAGFSTAASIAIFQQVQNLIEVVTRFLSDLDTQVANLSSRVYTFGPFQLNLSMFDLTTMSQELVSYVQPALSQVTGLVSTFATGALSTLGWILFILLVSYFVLVDATQVSDELLFVEIPGYDYDVRRLVRELRRIWNAFLRGQLVLIVVVFISYSILMTILGVRYSLGIALLAGLARFVPYVGPLTTWTITALVTFFQSSNYFGLAPWQYTLLVIVLAVVLDQIFDNIVSPRMLGQRLGVHPAAVLVAAIVAANLLGIIGLVLAAPTLATIQLLSRYMLRKMLDLDPWPVPELPEPRVSVIVQPRAWRRLQAWYRMISQRRS